MNDISIWIEFSGKFKSSEITNIIPNCKVTMEMGEIAKRGRFKDISNPISVVEIEDNSDKPYDERIDSLLNDASNIVRKLKLERILNVETVNIKKILWFNYNYEDQCNLEFNPKQLEIMGKLGMIFCISCYQTNVIIKK